MDYAALAAKLEAEEAAMKSGEVPPLDIAAVLAEPMDDDLL